MDEENSNLIENIDLQVGMFILLKNYPCEIIEIAHSKSGKHGVPKIRITAKGIFNGVKYEDIFIAHGQFTELLTVEKNTYSAKNINSNILQVFDEKYNQEIEIDLANTDFCSELKLCLDMMYMVHVTIFTYKTFHKIIGIYKSDR